MPYGEHIKLCGYFKGLKNNKQFYALPFLFSYPEKFVNNGHPLLEIDELNNDTLVKGILTISNPLYKMSKVISDSDLDSLVIVYARTAPGGDAIYANYYIEKPINNSDYFYIHEYNEQTGIFKASFNLHFRTKFDLEKLPKFYDFADTMVFDQCRIHTRMHLFIK